MNTCTVRITVLGAAALLAASVQAGIPVEREVQAVRAVQVYGGNGERVQRPIGAIDFSASGSAARRLGPWNVETDAFRDADGVIYYDDGSASSRRLERQYHRDGESRCTTLGNVTVCR